MAKDKITIRTDSEVINKIYTLKEETGFSISKIIELLIGKSSKEELRKEYDKKKEEKKK